MAATTGHKILIATEKPFAKEAMPLIMEVAQKANYPVALLENYTAPDQLYAAIADAEAVIVRSDKVTPELLTHAPQLKIVVRAGAGVDTIDLKACTARGIVVMNTPGQNSNAVAEMCFGQMITVARGWWQGKPGTELRGKQLGLQAYGNVGKYMAMIAKGFGMKVMAFDPFVTPARMAEDGVLAAESLAQLYAQCDYVSIHTPLTPETRGCVNWELLSTMKHGACLVNSARAEVIDEAALTRMLESRADFKYVADVAPKNAKDLEARFKVRVCFTAAKMGAQTEEANTNSGIAAVREIVDFFEKGDVRCQVNRS
ncbi:3-phosphoglycerate dehydrogenase [Pelomyxa schiedti]|nr:3-phosphoglycerate dehydrogenase [Pelomyxa schiedti]